MSTNMDITREFSADYTPIDKNEFAKYIKGIREDNNEKLGQEMSTRDLGAIIGIDYEMFRKILDMDYFLNEDDLFADEAGVEGFYIF